MDCGASTAKTAVVEGTVGVAKVWKKDGKTHTRTVFSQFVAKATQNSYASVCACLPCACAS